MSRFTARPSRKWVESWRDQTPDGFGFALKVPRGITAEKVLEGRGAEVEAFTA
jgi:uncharacterized protein YecE (DUF72 family)